MENHFFQSFFAPQQQFQSKIPEYIVYNEIIIEITNNWDYVQKMMNSFYEGKLEHVDQMEQNWLSFLHHNNIDIRTYKNEEDFLCNLWKNS
jgi:hypothetical protein